MGGGVPTDEKFKNLTETQWLIMHAAMQEKRKEDFEILQGILEYIAVLISMNPKETLRVVEERQRRTEIEDAERLGESEQLNKSGKDIHGQSVNNTFLDQIRQFGGDAAADALRDGSWATAPKVNETLSKDDMDLINQLKTQAIKMNLPIDEVLKKRKEESSLSKEDIDTDTVIF